MRKPLGFVAALAFVAVAAHAAPASTKASVCQPAKDGGTLTNGSGVQWTAARATARGCVWLSVRHRLVATSFNRYDEMRIFVRRRYRGATHTHELPRAAFGPGDRDPYGPLPWGIKGWSVSWPRITIVVETGHNYPANGGIDSSFTFHSRDGGRHWSWSENA